MFELLSVASYLPFLLVPTVLIIVMLWELIWKGFALWRSAKNGQKYWFIAVLIINSVGILPIIYLAFFSGRKPNKRTGKKVKRK